MEYNKKIEKISKFLSYVLRHKPESIGLVVDNNGWVCVSSLIENSQKSIKFTVDELRTVVATSDKQRFKFNSDETKIMANQGHSIGVDLQLEPIEPPEKLYHGSTRNFLDTIKKEGLKKMRRHHVHMYCSKNISVAKKTGSRHQGEHNAVVLEINAKKMYDDGFTFFKTDNDVYLTDFVPDVYLTELPD